MPGVSSRVGWNTGTGPSPELLRSIFSGITKKTRGGRKYARLVMDDSGRWRVARAADPDKTLPGDE